MTANERHSPDLVAVADLDLPADVLFDVLASDRRRFVVACLHEYETPMALADLADELATWEQNAVISEIPAEEVKSTYIALYHAHVPKLADAGIVEYDQERDAVAPTETVEELASRVPLPDVAAMHSTEDASVT